MSKVKPSIWPLLFTITGVVLMVGFGTWQLQRLEWKENLILQIEEGLKQSPVALPLLLKGISEVEYKRYKVTGIFQHDKEMHLFSTNLNGKPGYHIYTPLIRPNGAPVILNRGWVPEELKEQESRQGGLTKGLVTLNGIARLSRARTMFVPENNIKSNRWYYANIGEMATASSLETVVPIFLEAESTSGDFNWPRGGITRVNLPNRHLEYVFTWYSFAATLLVIFILFRRKQKMEMDE